MAKSVSPHINHRPISALRPTALGLILESRVDMGCDTDFAMYYSLCILDCSILGELNTVFLHCLDPLESVVYIRNTLETPF